MLDLFKTNSNNSFTKKFGSLFAIAFCLNITFLASNVFSNESAIDLSSQEQSNLNNGKLVLKGKKGDYVGQIIAVGNEAKAWEVLTDYENFKNFLPNITSSEVVSKNGSTTIFEQINIVDLFLLSKQFTVQIASTENYPQQIDFQLVNGDLKNLNGSWHIQTLSNNKILITHRVTVAPESKTEEAIFYGIYESSLEETLQAIALEVTTRSQSKSILNQ